MSSLPADTLAPSMISSASPSRIVAVARVATNGATEVKVTTRPLTRPMIVAHTIPMRMASGRGSPPLMSCATIAMVTTALLPIEKSMPPEIMSMVSPAAITASTLT